MKDEHMQTFMQVEKITFRATIPLVSHQIVIWVVLGIASAYHVFVVALFFVFDQKRHHAGSCKKSRR